MCLTQIFIFRGFCKLCPKFGHTSIKIKLSLLALVMLHKIRAMQYTWYVTNRKKNFSTLIFDLITYKMKEKCIIKGESQVHDCIEWLMG